MCIYIPYFYIIQDVSNGVYYAGSKYGQDANPDFFMSEGGYLTSSTTVKQIIAERGLDTFVVRKIRTFDTGAQALKYESRFLQKVNAAEHPLFYNKHNNDNVLSFGTDAWKELMVEKYGVDHPSKAPEIQEKKKQTLLENYGVDHPLKSPEIQEKRKQTLLENYGVDNPSKAPEVQEKRKEIWLEKYGVDNPSKAPEIQEKRKESWLEKYGVDHPSKAPEVKEKKSKSLTDYYKNNKVIFINNGNKTKSINVNDKEKYLSEGWILGRLKNKVIWINDGHKSTRINVEDKEKYLSEGWILGRLKNRKHSLSPL